MMMVSRPIGVIHSPYGEKGLKAPPQGGHKPEEVSQIEVFKEYADGLKDIEVFSHLIILFGKLHEIRSLTASSQPGHSIGQTQ